METQSFTNCTIYRTSEFMGNVCRLDCRTVTVESTQYAQYDNALLVKYIEKGKRTQRGFYLTYKPYLVIVPTKDAIDPDEMYGKPDASGSRVSRYSSFNDGWTTDFDAALKAAGVPILADYREYNTRDRYAKGSQA